MKFLGVVPGLLVAASVPSVSSFAGRTWSKVPFHVGTDRFRSQSRQSTAVKAASTVEYLSETYPSLSEEFLDGIRQVASIAYSHVTAPQVLTNENDDDQDPEDKAISRAVAYSRMPGLVLRSRVKTLLSENFAFYSQDTGILNRFAFIAMTKLLDNGFPGRITASHTFEAHDDGLVTFVAKPKAEQFNDFAFDGKIYPVSDVSPVVVRGDYEVHVVAFDASGRILSHLVEICDEDTVRKLIEDEGDVATFTDDQLVDMESKLKTLYNKLDTLKDQTSALAYNKVLGDIEDTEAELKEHQSRIADQTSNTGGHTGLAGILYALGETDISREKISSVLSEKALEVAKDFFDDSWRPTTEMGGISVPSCCLQEVGDISEN